MAALKAAAKAAIDEFVTGDNAGALLRAAFHDAGTFNAAKKTGGANGSLRLEIGQPENGGLQYAQLFIQKIKKAAPEKLTWADLYQLAGAAAVEKTGGPTIDVKIGRPDAARADPAGQLPSLTDDAPTLKANFGRNGKAFDP